MTTLEICVKKDIARSLHTAIDCELSGDFEQAYRFYVEGLYLVAEALKKDLTLDQSQLTLRDKCNLIQFAKQSLGRVTGLLGENDSKGEGKCDGDLPTSYPSAPPTASAGYGPRAPSPPPPYSGHLASVVVASPTSDGAHHQTEAEEMMMSRYQRRLGLAVSPHHRQNIQLEMARQLIENAAISRSNLVRTTAWAMQNAHKKFQIQEKLSNGKLRESDFRKQQLYTIALQFNEGNSWLSQLAQDLVLFPSNEKVTRELLDVVLTDNSHPIKATINQMQDKVTALITDAIINSESVPQAHLFDDICKVIKEDINIVQEVMKALFEPLKTVRNSVLTSESVHHVYFSQVKPPLISLLRVVHVEVKSSLEEKMKQQSTGSVSSDCLTEAVSKLHYLTTLHNPYDMLDCTVHIIKLLASSSFDRDHTSSIGADDLLPRLCQAVIASGMPDIYAEAYFMEAFMPSEKALGEEGYAVTMLQSAIAHLTSSKIFHD